MIHISISSFIAAVAHAAFTDLLDKGRFVLFF